MQDHHANDRGTIVRILVLGYLFFEDLYLGILTPLRLHQAPQANFVLHC